METINSRAFVSFDERCPYSCRHCYTLDLPKRKVRGIDEIVKSIAGNDFDIVYISQRKDNFVNPDEGLDLCEKIFDKYACNLMLITRNVFDVAQTSRLINLASEMTKKGKNLFVAVSVIAKQAAAISENLNKIPSTQERLDFLSTIHSEGLLSILLIRPVFPDRIIPIKEVLDIVKESEGKVSCVVAGGLAVNDEIEKRLGMAFGQNELLLDHEYLDGAMEGDLRFIDVTRELDMIEALCIESKIPFFLHSMSAINHLVN